MRLNGGFCNSGAVAEGIAVVFFPSGRIVAAMRAWWTLLLLTAAMASASPIVREPGVIYLSDFDIPPLKLALRGPAPCYFEWTGQRYAGTLRFPQTVRLDAVAPDGRLRVRGNAQQGGVAAWVAPDLLQPLPEGFADNLRKADERRLMVEDLIARGEAAIGMTPAEIERSLGKPQKRSSKVGREGSEQVFEYIKYDLVPQTVWAPSTSQVVTRAVAGPQRRLQTVTVRNGVGASTVFVKVPVGTIKVAFVNGVAESIEQSEGTLAGANAAIVVPPVTVGW